MTRIGLKNEPLKFTFLEERKYMLSEIVHTVLDLYTRVVRNVMNAPLAIALIQVVMGIHLKNNNIEIIYIIQLQIVSLQSIYILEKKVDMSRNKFDALKIDIMEFTGL